MYVSGMTRTPISLRPDYASQTRLFGRTVTRSATATLLSHVHGTFIKDVLAEHYPAEPATALVTKASSAPSSMTNQEWATALTSAVVPEFLMSLGPAAAGAATLQSSDLQFVFDQAGSIVVTYLIHDSANATWTTEGSPFNVREFSIDGPVLVPRKLGSTSVFSRKSFSHSLPNIEKMVGTGLRESAMVALDEALFDANAADGSRPAGLRSGISVTAGVSENTNKMEAMREDIALLLGTIAPIAGNAPIIIVASPVQAMFLKLSSGPNPPCRVLASSALTSGTVLAVSSSVLVSAMSATPSFSVSDQTTLDDLDQLLSDRGYRPQQQPVMTAETNKAWNDWLRVEVKKLLWNERDGAIAVTLANVMTDQRNQLIDELQNVITELRGEVAELRAAMIVGAVVDERSRPRPDIVCNCTARVRPAPVCRCQWTDARL